MNINVKYLKTIKNTTKRNFAVIQDRPNQSGVMISESRK